jgi:hypothetical protein
LDSKLEPEKYPGSKYYEEQGKLDLQIISKPDQGKIRV